METLFAVVSAPLFAFSCAVTVLAGFVKGNVGFALPLVMVSGMGIFLPPELVMAGLIVPVLVTNGWQALRGGWHAAWAVLVKHRRFVGVTCVMILISAQLLLRIPVDVMLLVLGVVVVVLCLVQLAGWRPVISQGKEARFEWIAGGLAGTMGGLSGTWGTPTVLYLLAMGTPRKEQISVQGVIYGLGAVMLVLGHMQSGVLNAQTAVFSLALVLPSLIGMAIGLRVGDRLDQERFRKLTLIVLIIAGANLIRRGVMG